jgi:acetoin utilization deacetylase AcuC-like enzyme/formylglycine-generating enzyme required for sulfatase activity
LARRLALVLFLGAGLGCDQAKSESPIQGTLPVIHTSLGPEMLLVPAGTFRMGSVTGSESEGPVHAVKLDAFLMDRTEVTQELFAKLNVPNPSHFKSPHLPVEQVTWPQAALFCNTRSRAEGLEPCYNEDTSECDFSKNGYRLPTEAEWEYACRAGSTSDYAFPSPRTADHAWYAENSGKTTHPVATREPNAWGFYDLLGNVAEWCNDVYAKDYYSKSPLENPRGPASQAEGDRYLLRGGSWTSGAAALRSASRSAENPGFSDACLARDAIGFRCVRKPLALSLPKQGRRGPSPATWTAFLDGEAASKDPKTGLVYQDLYLEHRTGEGFPERPDRLRAILRRLREKEFWTALVPIPPVAHPEEWITAIHSKEYLERVKKACEACGDEIHHLDTGDMPICSKSYEVALGAVGGVLGAVDAVMEGKVRNAFCAVRPPGHHALRETAMGFCLFNNVAIAARYIQKKHRLARVLIVDWDVHHGNGTQDAFYEDGTVFYFSTHLKAPFYPRTGHVDETGRGAGAHCILNVPLEVGAGDLEVLKAYQEKLKPAALAFKPDFVLVSCGFDSHENDTLGRLSITTEGFGKMTRLVKAIAHECAQDRLVTVLEGGYNLDNLANASEAHVRALME